MTTELTPVGVTCNLDCGYCYQHPIRDAGNFGGAYDVDAMIAAAREEGGEFILFGGEPLLVDKADARRLFAAGLEQSKSEEHPNGRNGIQTNGTLIDDEWIAIFLEYNVHVGISIDGPGDLNRSRFKANVATTDELTARTESAIAKLCDAGSIPSLIVTLYRGNALPDRRRSLKAWFQYLDGLGISSVRLHTLEVDDDRVGERWALSSAETIDALLDLAAFESGLSKLRFDLFKEERALLMGEDKWVGCIWNACDPFTTVAVRGIDGEGNRTNCGRTNKAGVQVLKADTYGYERQLALYATPQEYGGCQGCRFFFACKGQCPGTGEGSDWRNRSDQCDTLKATFAHFESALIHEGKQPISVAPDLEPIEAVLLEYWAQGINLRLFEVVDCVRNGIPIPSGRLEHGTAHGDSHGDHDDAGGAHHTDQGHQDVPHADHTLHTDSDAPEGERETMVGVAEVRS